MALLADPNRDYEDIKMCNCATCRVVLLGKSEEDWYNSLTDLQRRQLPRLLCGRLEDRPYCFVCYHKCLLAKPTQQTPTATQRSNGHV